MRQMTALLREGRAPAEVMSKHRRQTARAKAGRNDPCPCGSGLKYKKCHGAQKRVSKKPSKMQFR